MEIDRGRLIDHLHLVTADLAAMKRFYTAALESLGLSFGGVADDHFWCDELFVSTPDSRAASGRVTGRVHLALQASSPEQVDGFFAAAVAAGGRDNGAPGPRPYHPRYYAAYVLDPDGNNVEAVHHGPAQRSAASIVISFTMPG